MYTSYFIPYFRFLRRITMITMITIEITNPITPIGNSIAKTITPALSSELLSSLMLTANNNNNDKR